MEAFSSTAKNAGRVGLNYPAGPRRAPAASGIIGPDWGFIGSGVGSEGANDFLPVLIDDDSNPSIPTIKI